MKASLRLIEKSYCKRLALTKEKFREIIKRSPDREVTSSTKEVIRDLAISSNQYLNQIKDNIFHGFELYTEFDHLHSAKIIFRFMSGIERFEPKLETFEKDFIIKPPQGKLLDREFFSQELNKIFAEIISARMINRPNTKIVYVGIFKRQDRTIGEFTQDGHVSNFDPSSINRLYAKFAGKPVVNEQFDFI